VRGKLIVFEGTDSSGKHTQAKLLEKRLLNQGKKIELSGFPTYQKTMLGELVSRYLKGDFGSKEDTGPEIATLFFVIDRYQFKDIFRKKLDEGTTIILDRYIASNIFQAAHAEGEERFKIWEWAKTVQSRLPQPDVTIFLDMPPKVSEKLFAAREIKNALVGKSKDILEADLAYQEKVRKLYLEIARKEGWIIIDCCKEGMLRKPEDIHEEVYEKLKERGIFQSDKY